MIENKFKVLLLKDIVFGKNSKLLPLILMDLIKLKKKYSLKRSLRFYFLSLLYKKDAGDFDKYVDDTVLIRILNYNSRQGSWPLLADKVVFSQIMKALPGSTALYLGKIENGFIFDSEDKGVKLSSYTDLVPYLNELLEQYKVVFIKKDVSYGGKGVYRVTNISDFDFNKVDINGKYLIEKGLTQHDDLNKINPYCINTLRVITLNRNGEVKVTSSLLRMGVDKSHNDNSTTGGIYVAYDLKENKLYKTANKDAEKGGRSYVKHPDTHFVFENQPLPYPDRVISLVAEAAKLFPDRYIVGWDVAYTPQGPVIIEGNTNPCPIQMQIALRGLRNNRLYDNLYHEFYG